MTPRDHRARPGTTPAERSRLLGGLTPAQFLRKHWHRHPRLIREALQGFDGFLDRSRMFELACRDGVESRLVIRDGRQWSLDHGPFRRKDLSRLPARNWTLLVQGVDLHLDDGARLLSRFDFVPRARLDDLMVSYAVPGGGVGPHFDSYDVFLLQGPGRRRWRISAQNELDLRPNVPLRILRRFRAEDSFVLGPGDMLYLPPRFAHEGTALDECLTYSIGFRAPTYSELAQEFLHDLADGLDLPGRYADPGLTVSRHPGRLPSKLTDAAEAELRRVRWRRRTLESFLGRYLSEPKREVVFEPLEELPSAAALRRSLAGGGIRLHRKSRLLYCTGAAFMNGEVYRFPRGVPSWLVELADRGEVLRPSLTPAGLELVREWLGDGFIVLLQP